MTKAWIYSIWFLVNGPCLGATLSVAPDGSGDFQTIQAAVDQAGNLDTIVLQPSLYTGPGNVDVVISLKDLIIQGTEPNDPNVVQNTIIDCNSGPAAPHRAFDLKPERIGITLKGLTIINGYGRVTGGAVKCRGSITLENCVIHDCSAALGGAIYCSTLWDENHQAAQLLGMLHLFHCTLENNAAYEGGAVYAGGSQVVLHHCTLQYNRSTRYGGAMAEVMGHIEISHTALLGNRSQYGGGINVYNSDTALADSMLVGNQAARQGGAVFSQSGEDLDVIGGMTLDRSCLAANVAGDQTGGLYVKESTSEPQIQPLRRLRNSILWSNRDRYGTDLAAQLAGPDLDVAYCCLQDDTPLDGNVPYNPSNLDSDPLWVRSPNDGGDGWGDNPKTPTRDEAANDDFGDLHLTAASPCIDAGQPLPWLLTSDVDLDGQPRGLDGRVDIGVDEYSVSPYRVLEPRADDFFTMGSTVPISWTGPAGGDRVQIEVSLDQGQTWAMIEPNAPATGTLTWQAPNVNIIRLGAMRIHPIQGPESQTAYSGFFTLYPANGSPSTTAWRTLGGNFQRTSHTTRQGPVMGCIQWTFATSSVICNSVGLGTAGQIYVPTLNGQLTCLNNTGQVLWTYRTGSMITSAPTVADDGTISVGCADGSLHVISSQGQRQQVIQLPGSPVSTIAILPDGRRVIGAGSAGVMIIRPDGSDQQRLNLDIGNTCPSLGPDGTIYCVDQVTGLWAVDGNNNIEKWAVTPGASWQGSLCYPVITDNRVILGALNDPNLYAFNASTGQPLWAVDLTRDAGTETWSEPAVGPDGTLYASLNDGYLRAVNSDGQRLWTTRLGDSRGFTLCVDPDATIFAAGDDGLLTVLNPDGHIIARFDAGMPLSYPVITDDHTLLVSGVQGQGLTLSSGLLIALSPYVVCDPLDLAPVTASNP